MVAASEGRHSATQAVHKAVRLLTLLRDAGAPSLSVGELSRVTGWTKSGVSRLLAALQQEGLVRQDPATDRYALGLGLVALAGAVLAADQTYALCRPHLVALAAASGETANLSVVERGQLLTVDEVPSAQPIKLSGWIGVRQPLHGSSSGKVLLAALPDEEQAVILAAPLAPLTARTVTDPVVLRQELERVRAVGYALNRDELADGLTSVAAPVRDHGGRVVAALSAAGPSYRFTPAALDHCVTLVIEAATAASRTLGCRVPAAG